MMGKEITEPNTLRAEAEARLFSAFTLALSNQIADGLQYELDVHKIELEMQNEELRRAYADLDVSRDRYVDLYNFSPVGYLTITYDGLISETNLITAKLLGVDRGTLLFSRFSSFLIPEDGDRWHLFFVGVIKKQNQQKNIQLTLKHSSGSTFSVLLNCLLVTFNDQDSKLRVTISDITEINISEQKYRALFESSRDAIFIKSRERNLCEPECLANIELAFQNEERDKRAEELVIANNELHIAVNALEAQEVKLNAIFNSAVEGIITIDMNDIILSVNDSVEIIFGYQSKELIGSNIRKILKIPSREDAYGMAPFVAENNSEIHEIEGKHKNGNVLPLDMSRADYLINNVHYFTKIVRDVSQRKLREEKDMGHLHELAHVTRLGMMGEMASGMAHEINQPLTAISNYAQVISNLIKNENINLVALTEVAEKTQQQALRAGKIIHLMKGFIQSKIIVNSSTDINDLIRQSVDLCSYDLKLRNEHEIS